MTRFAGKVAIVTGASEGIGRALSLALADQKARVVVAARNEKRLQELKGEIEKRGAEALAVVTDVTESQACEDLIKKTVEAFGQIDFLIANAGRTMWTKFEDIADLGMVEDLMQLNYMGSVYCVHYALPWLKKSKGLIVPIASVAGLTGVPCRTAYSASKHAMIGFFESLRIELQSTGVDITIIAPDFVLSELHRRAYNKDGGELGVSPMQESKITTSEECAIQIIEAMEKRKRFHVTSGRARFGRWLKLISPKTVDKIAAKAIEKGM